MRDFSALHWMPWLQAALALAIVAVSIRIYTQLVRRLLAGRGRVDSGPFGFPDLLMAVVLMSWFGSLALRGFSRTGPAPALTDSTVVSTVVLFGAIVAVIALFLKARQVNVSRLFGLWPLRFPAIRSGVALLLAALPLVFAVSVLIRWMAGEELEPQEVVKYFSHAAESAQWDRIAMAAVFGTIFAPATEEFIFRGYFYGVLRRYLRPLPAMFAVSLLFASIHLSAAAFIPLFLLACCLTLAYEASGSLWTPVLMHALFNAIMLAAMLFTALNS